MKLARFAAEDGVERIGVVSGDEIRDVTDAVSGSMLALMTADEVGLEKIVEAAAIATETWHVAGVRLLAPVVPQVRVFGIGLNYKDHATESKMQTQKVPTVFMKLASSVVGHEDDILLPDTVTEQTDYEAELAVVIGKGGHRIAAADWQRHIFGYTIVNDVSARDVQLATSQWMLGKSFPAFTPIGPYIVTRHEVDDPHALDIRLTIDDVVMQESNTSLLIFKVPELIEYISSIVPLEPGDIISTGTPPGVGMGRTPQRWLKPGELIEITIELIGTLRNRTRAAD